MYFSQNVYGSAIKTKRQTYKFNYMPFNKTNMLNRKQYFTSVISSLISNSRFQIKPCYRVPNYYNYIVCFLCRYESTITAQFFGHTHFDEFELFYDTQNLGRPVSIAYVGPSVTPYYDLNPGYRIYYVDGDREHSTRVNTNWNFPTR